MNHIRIRRPRARRERRGLGQSRRTRQTRDIVRARDARADRALQEGTGT
jgi:hypothetical protein